MRTPIIIGLVLAFGVGAICGVLATLGSLFIMQQQDHDHDEVLHAYGKTATPAVTVADVEVWVARADIPAGTVIDDPDLYFRPQYYASGTEPPAAITARQQLRNKQVVRPLAANQVVTGDYLMPPITGLKPGMRLVAIVVPDSADGFLLPGSHVDVLAVRKSSEGRAEAKVLVEDLLVLAINQTLPLPKPADITILLAATPVQAQMIIEARAAGTLHVVLRAPEEAKPAAGDRGNK
jgi:Flp pilus assembly protein CpaB